jgi:hypothetical protein
MFEIIALVLIVICIGNPMYALVIIPSVALFWFVLWKIVESGWPGPGTSEPEGNGDDNDHCDGCCGHH